MVSTILKFKSSLLEWAEMPDLLFAYSFHPRSGKLIKEPSQGLRGFIGHSSHCVRFVKEKTLKSAVLVLRHQRYGNLGISDETEENSIFKALQWSSKQAKARC